MRPVESLSAISEDALMPMPDIEFTNWFTLCCTSVVPALP